MPKQKKISLEGVFSDYLQLDVEDRLKIYEGVSNDLKEIETKARIAIGEKEDMLDKIKSVLHPAK